ncbi:MAG TPA: alkaline phosphatase family protein [Polyangia bacterium]|nr:alkaline phosphatase family protein [Polyangia bacterium]
MRLSWIFACTLVLAGCGGNNNDNGEPSIIPPDLSAGGGDDGGDGTGGNGNDDGGTLAPDGGSATPIRYVVVIVKENHTFDNYFMNFPGATSATTGKKSDGTTLTRPKAPDGDLAGDNPHSNAAAITDYDGGKMDGFDKGTPDQPNRPYFYYAESQIPNYWKYARTFALFDNFFSTTAGPTSPGHFAIAAGQSPFLDNPYCSDGSTTCKDGCISPDPISKVDSLDFKTCTIKSGPSCIDVPTVVDMLPKGVTWRAYGTGTQPNINSPYSLVKKLGGDAAVRAAHFRDNTHLFTDLANDDLANFMQIDVYSGPNEASEHPPSYPCGGENYTVQIVNGLMQSSHWKEMAIVITWDDFGGWFDSVKPTVSTCGTKGEFVNTGFRLPAIVISPYAKQAVIHTKTEQVSITNLVEQLLGAPPISSIDPDARDGKAGSMLGAFDFTQAPRAPLILQQRTCP